jgi:excisionase family DNA binding protein
MKRLHGVKEAAEILGISTYTVRSYIRQGKIRPVRFGRRVLLEEAELERFVAGSKPHNNTTQPEIPQEVIADVPAVEPNGVRSSVANRRVR